MVVAVASPSTGIQQDEREKMEATLYDATEMTYLTITHTTHDEAVTVAKKKKKKTMLYVLSVAAACAAVLFTWGALVARSSGGTTAIAEGGGALEGISNYPKVNIKNKTNRPASGMVEYLGDGSVFDMVGSQCEADLYHVNPGEPWMAPKDRGVC